MLDPVKLYEECIDLAKESKCKKLGFGAILVDVVAQKIVTRASNGPMKPLAHICEPECIRNKIPSRTESMIGACAHAEEKCMFAAASMGVNLHLCEIFIQGVKPGGEHLTRQGTEFTCIRCATEMYLTGIRGVNVWFEDEWHLIRPDDAMKQAFLYATQAKELTTQK